MRTIFLADAHLHDPGDPNYRRLLHFLHGLQGVADTLCILGDLFDFRVGLPALNFPEHEELLEALACLSRSGTRLIYLEGNHDFHLGSAFAERIGAELHAGPVAVELQGQRVLLCHGDLVNAADWRYRLLYRILRNQITVLAAKLVPAPLVQAIRQRLQKTSRKRYGKDRVRWDYRAIISAYGNKVRGEGFDAVVLGHFHLPFIEQSDGFTLLSLGDWIGQFSYGELRDGVFSLSTDQP